MTVVVVKHFYFSSNVYQLDLRSQKAKKKLNSKGSVEMRIKMGKGMTLEPLMFIDIFTQSTIKFFFDITYGSESSRIETVKVNTT